MSCSFLSQTISHPPQPINSEWKQSRFIIDNRKNILFSHKPFSYLQDTTRPKHQSFQFSNETFNGQNRFQKDLSAEASISESNFYSKYKDKTSPGNLLRNYENPKNQVGVREQKYALRDFENNKNISKFAHDAHSNFIQNEEIRKIYEISSPSKNPFVTFEDSEVWPWIAREADDSISVSSSKDQTPSRVLTLPNGRYNQTPELRSRNAVENLEPQITTLETPTTTPFLWQLAREKVKEENEVDKSKRFLDSKEKHVYETRIETVSYNKQIIFNPQKTETSTEELDWYRAIDVPAEKTASNVEETYGKQEVNVYADSFYDRPKINFKEPESNFKISGRNYKKLEENYEEPERNFEEPERNYEEPEKNYEGSEKDYEEPERNYEEPEINYEEPEKNYEGSEKNYEEPERNYEERERNYEDTEKNYEIRKAIHVMSDGRTKDEDKEDKFGYVVEESNFKRYRVEERTPDGFIVGEYGVVSHDDGSLRGVRYTADGTANPQLIYESLIKFLSL